MLSAIKFLKRPLKLQRYIALWQKSVSQGLVVISSEIIIMCAASSISELQNLYARLNGYIMCCWKGMENWHCGCQNHSVSSNAWYTQQFLKSCFWYWKRFLGKASSNSKIRYDVRVSHPAWSAWCLSKNDSSLSDINFYILASLTFFAKKWNFVQKGKKISQALPNFPRNSVKRCVR